MRQKFFVKDQNDDWHVAIADWTEDAKEGALRCTYCGVELMPDVCSEVWKAPNEELWCTLPKQQPYYGTALRHCNLYGASPQWFWVGRPPLGEPVVVANLEHVSIVPSERLSRLLEYVSYLTDERVGEWHDGDYEGPLHEFLGMTEEEYKVFVEKNVLPGDMKDLSKKITEEAADDSEEEDSGGEVPGVEEGAGSEEGETS